LVNIIGSEMGAITDLFAGVPVSDLDASTDWYTRFFGRPPDSRVGEEMLWEIDEHAWLFIEPNAARAGAGRSPSPSPGSTRCSSASLPSASSTNRSRLTRTESAT
jgi:catechol 2,3-dioxygenase-like lactoylglutathione lyase family enzyme